MEIRKPKYIVAPGYVISVNDGQRHWITFDQLVHLYGVNPKDCVMDFDGSGYGKKYMWAIWLAPDATGRYKLPQD